MRLIDRYVLRQAGLAFLACLAGLTALIWVTQALRQFDLVTSQGQTALIFLVITALALPSLVVIIAPIALFIAIMWTLNRLNGDSELVVLGATGLSTARLMAPFAVLAVAVSVLVGAITLVGQPASMHELRFWLTQVKADFLSKIVRPGQFTTVSGGITFHIRERQPNGALLGIFVQDARNPDQVLTYIAESGQIVDQKLDSGQPGTDHEASTFLVLEKGSVQRQTGGRDQGASPDAAIVTFERYAFDLSRLLDEPEVTHFKPRERYTSELWNVARADADDAGGRGRIRAELVDRFVAPLYPVAFMVVALAALGTARTTRQGRGLAVLSAILAIAAIRVLGFAFQTLSVRAHGAAALAFLTPVVASAIGLALILGWSPRAAWERLAGGHPALPHGAGA